MANFEVSDQKLKELKLKGYSNNKIAKEVGVDRRSVDRRFNKMARKGWSPSHDLTRPVPDGFHLRGASTLYDDDGQIRLQWVKSNIDHERQLELLEEAISSLIAELPQYPITKASKKLSYNDTLSVFPLGDPHIGMLAWEDECGEAWDLDIAEETFRKMFDIVVQKSPPSKKAMLEILGDTLHYDNMAGMTSRSGNILDTDSRYPKMAAVCVRIVLNMINSLLQRHKEVVIDIVKGNHDDIGSIWLRELLIQVYKKDKRVTIVEGQGPIHIYEFGKVLIASHHGHTIKMDQLPITIASDYSEAWGRTKHRYCLTGHIHHDSKLKKVGLEYTGMDVESFRTLATKDSYATWGGWRSKRDTKCIVYHKELGEIERYTASADALMIQI